MSAVHPRVAFVARTVRRLARVALGALLLGWGAYRTLDFLFPFPEPALRATPASPVVTAEGGRRLRVGLTPQDERALPLGDASVSPHLLHALVAEEDRRFHAHGGVDVRALVRAVTSTLSGRREGGSTLSMQTARLLAPSPRTLAGKFVQLFRAVQLEERCSKDEILRLYLDRAPFGGNLRGVGAAAHAWFGRQPSDLSAGQAALLVSALPAPGRLSPLVDPSGARGRRDRVLDSMRAEGLLDQQAWKHARAEPLGLEPTPFPDLAPHAWQQVLDGSTTIDLRLQAALERLVRDEGEPDGLAVVLVEHGLPPGVDGERRPVVRALLGAREPSASTLDATRRPRAAGSTLKPFLWALALDEGAIAPSTRLLDLPWESPEWSPTDLVPADRGPVSASAALAASWNLPAVRLAASLPRGRFVETLHAAGLRHVRGLESGTQVDLALGTDDVTPLELAQAYAALASGGRAWPLSLSAGTLLAQPRVVCSPGAASLVTQMLSAPERERPEGAAPSGVAWKTGTSSRRRDAWAAGFTERFTAVVWRGWLDGRPDPNLLGLRSAAPLLFRVLAAADANPAPHGARSDSPALRRECVCAETGLAARSTCPETRTDLVPAGARPLATCPTHVELGVDRATGELCCERCRSRHDVVLRAFALHAPAEAAWRRRSGLPVEPLPPHARDCDAPLEPAAATPVFLTPVHEQRLVPDGRGEVLLRAVSCEGGPLRLLVDAAALNGAETLEDDRARGVRLAPGRHALTLLTRSGRHASITVFVQAERP